MIEPGLYPISFHDLVSCSERDCTARAVSVRMPENEYLCLNHQYPRPSDVTEL